MSVSTADPALVQRRLRNLLATLATTLVDSLTERAEAIAGHAGATPAALTFLLQEPGQSIEQLRLPLALTQSATVRLVDRLAADGLVERRRGAGPDGRAVAVHLTEAGIGIAQAILDDRDAAMAQALQDLDSAELSTFNGMVEKILATVTEDPRHGERMCRMCDLDACPTRACPVTVAGELHAAARSAAPR